MMYKEYEQCSCTRCFCCSRTILYHPSQNCHSVYYTWARPTDFVSVSNAGVQIFIHHILCMFLDSFNGEYFNDSMHQWQQDKQQLLDWTCCRIYCNNEGRKCANLAQRSFKTGLKPYRFEKPFEKN